MTGKSHIITGFVSAGALCSTYCFLHAFPEGLAACKAADMSFHFLFDMKFTAGLYIPLCILFYLFGTVIPDIDSPHSLIGRYAYLPIRHRTWTHCFLPIILCVIISVWFRPVVFFGIGIFIHLFYDSFSGTGIRWLYPLQFRYVCVLYRTGGLSEYIFVAISSIALLFYSFWALNHAFHFVALPF